MQNLNGIYYVEVKGKRYIVHPKEKNILKLREEPKSSGSQIPVQNGTQIMRNKKVVRNDNNEIRVKSYLQKKQPNIQHSEFKQPSCCHSCKRKNWFEFDKGWYFKI